MYPEDALLAACETEAVLAPSAERVRPETPAFDDVFVRYNGMVFQLVFRLLGDREEALDVTQEVFLTVHRKLAAFRGESSIKTWIYRIAVNRASNRFRWWNRLRRRGTVSLDDHLSADKEPCLVDTIQCPGRSPEETLLRLEQRAEIERCLSRLPHEQRTAVVLRDIQGLSYEEIAQATKVSLGTVKSRIARGREELKRRLNGKLGPVSGESGEP